MTSYALVPVAAVYDSRLPTLAVRLLFYFGGQGKTAGLGGYCWKTPVEIGRDTHLDPTTVRTLRRRLTKLGYLEKRPGAFNPVAAQALPFKLACYRPRLEVRGDRASAS